MRSITEILSHITGNQKPNLMIVPNIDTLDEVSLKQMKACGGTFGSAIVGSCSSEALTRAMTHSMDTIIGKARDMVDKLDPNTYIIYLGEPIGGIKGLSGIGSPSADPFGFR